METGPQYEVEVYEDSDSEWRWRLWAENGQNVGGTQQGNKNRSHIVQMVNQIFKGAPNVSGPDLRKE